MEGLHASSSLKKESLVTSIVLDLAAALFTPETPEVFSGLKQAPPPLHRHNGE